MSNVISDVVSINDGLPFVGMKVHYSVAGKGEIGSVCQLAFVVAVTVNPINPTPMVNFCVFEPAAITFMKGIEHNEDRSPGTWHHMHVD